MAYRRETTWAWAVQGLYLKKWQRVLTGKTYSESMQAIENFRKNEPDIQFRIKIVRQKIKA